MADYRYRYTDVPSLLQGDMPDDGEQVCWRCRRYGIMDFHHILPNARKEASEKLGAWVWLCRPCHRKIHNTAQGIRQWEKWKKDCQTEFERFHTREEWMRYAHKNYRD